MGAASLTQQALEGRYSAIRPAGTLPAPLHPPQPDLGLVPLPRPALLGLTAGGCTGPGAHGHDRLMSSSLSGHPPSLGQEGAEVLSCSSWPEAR